MHNFTSIMFKISEYLRTRSISKHICYITCVSLIIVVVLAMEEKYEAQIYCYNATHNISTSHTNLVQTIGIAKWLYIYGIILAVSVFIITISLIMSINNKGRIAAYLFLIYCCLILFNLIWTIVGGVILWHYCPDLSPIEINYLMRVVIIISYCTAGLL